MNLTTAISSISEDDYNRLFPEHATIITKNPDPALLALFESLTPAPETTEIASAAFIPLLSRARTLGILNLASPDSEKFIPGTATDAVENLGRKLATVIENNLLSAQIQQLLRTDPLTKLYNRGVLDEVLPIEFARASRYNHPLSLIKIDLDDFREINNIYGHATGDQVLQEVGTLIISNLRQHDIGLRYGGDEFTIILPDTDSTEAQKVIDRLTHLVADKTIFIDQNIQLQIEMSAGFSNFPDDPATSAQTLLEIADNNLYEIKKKRGELASD
jgi:diguanylate cyclase (GGDEF)-like protein